MKIAASRIEAFLREPDVNCVLIYGPDRGLVRERARALALTVVENLNDPFRVSHLAGPAVKKDPALLADEAGALSLTGGRRVVRVEDAADGLTAAFKAYLRDNLPPVGNGGALIIAEAGELTTRSSLRRLFEQAKNAASVACYGDGADDLGRVIRQSLDGHGLSVEPDAMAYLKENLGADRLVSRTELEKLALYKGEPGTVSLEDAAACIGDSAATSLDRVVYAACGGDQRGLDLALGRVLGEGVHPVGILRAAARHLLRLHQTAGLMAKGQSADQAMRALRPPVIFFLRDPFRLQLRLWNTDRLARALDLVTEAELDCKTTGMPVDAVCGRALMRMAQAARAR